MKEPRITASKLSAFCVPDPRWFCLWRLLHVNFKKPFNFPLPAVMQYLDKHQKQIARVSLQTDGQLPKFFGPFSSATELLPIDNLSGYHEETRLKLYGIPDLVFKAEDGTLMILDNKTAAVKEDDHPLSAAYRTQVNFYAYLFQHAQTAHTVSRIGLLYYTFAPLSDEKILDAFGDHEIWATFEPHVKEVELNPDGIIPPLLRTVRELYDLTEPPAAKKGCPDCALLDAFASLLKNGSEEGRLPIAVDQQTLKMYVARQRILKLQGLRHRDVLVLLPLVADPLGVLAQWDFSHDSDD
jgi:hypothetical protein